MKIVASNSLTVSNVNDGTITHTAWSYSADGTDRFTTVYPNLNLLKNTKSQSYTSTGTASNNSSDIYSLDGVVADILNKQLIITYNYDITNSSGTWSGTIRPTYGLGGTNQAVSNTNLSGTHKETATFTSVGQSSYRILTSGLPAGTIVTITNLKVEFGSIATPYMPSSSEVITADWPSYIGQYSDFTSTVSTDPAKYAPWTIFKGNDGVGVTSTVITYAISTSGTTAPSTGWTSSVPSPVKGQYLWTKTVWAYTNNSSKTGYSVTYISKDGTNGTNGTSGIIVSSVAPSSPQTGQLWQDTSTTPQLVKKWTGSEWVIWAFYAQNLKADSLETVSAIIGKISNTFDNSSGGIDNKGEIIIEDSIKVVYYNANTRTTIDLVTSTSGQGLFAQYLPDKNDTTKFQQAWYTPSYLYFLDSINNWTGQITAENVTLSSWQNLILQSGFTAGDGVQPQYRRIKNLDGSYSVQFRGAISPTSGNFPTTQVQVATLSGVYLPPTNAMRQGSDNTGKGGRVAATPAGKFYIWAPNTSSYVYIDALTYIN